MLALLERRQPISALGGTHYPPSKRALHLPRSGTATPYFWQRFFADRSEL